MRNRTFMHTVRDDSLLGSMRFVSRHEDTQVYGAILPKSMTNQAMLDSVAYKTYYAIASGAEPPKSKKPKMKFDSAISFEETPSKKKPTKAKKDVPSKRSQLLNLNQLRRRHRLRLIEAKVLDESEDKTIITDEGTCAKPWVPDVPKYLFESENESWRDSSNDESNDNDSDEVNKDDDEDDVESDVNKGKKASEYAKDLDVNSLDAEREKKGKGDAEMTDADKDEKSSTLAPPLLTVPVIAILETSTVAAMTAPLIIQPFSSIPQMTTPTPIPTTEQITSSIFALLDFTSLFEFDQRVSALEQELSQVKQSYTAEFEKKAQAEKEKYIDIIGNYEEISKMNTINESLKNVVLAKSYSQPQSTYEAATSLTEFKLKRIMLDQVEKDIFDSYGKVYSLKRGREDKDKDEDPPAGSDQGLKKRKTSKDAKPPKGSNKSAQAEEPVYEIADTEMPQDQRDDMEKPPTPDRDCNAGKQIDFKPSQTWISKIGKARKPPTTFDELMSTPIDFSAYVLHNQKIENLTQEHLVRPTFNLLKGACKSRVELEYHLEECYKAVTDKLDWINPEGHEYPFDLSKPLPLIEDQGHQVVPRQ
ncbi:hypothetical protein Tco_0273235 [Tanacetum coccineum]